MMTEYRRKEILENLSDAVVKFDEERAVRYATAAIAEQLDATDAIMNGLAAGMAVVGDLYDRHEYFVPELLVCADTLYKGLEILESHVTESRSPKSQIQIVIGSVQGDVHDIGKNLVKLMFEVAGFKVHDLGCDVPIERFVEAQRRTGADIVALSAMMTTTMVRMKDAVSQLKKDGNGAAVMVGGAPVTGEVARLYGADGYADGAGTAVQEVMRLISGL